MPSRKLLKKELGGVVLFSKDTTYPLRKYSESLPLLGPVPLSPDLFAASRWLWLRLPRPSLSRLAQHIPWHQRRGGANEVGGATDLDR